MKEKKLTLQDISKIADVHIRIMLVDRGIEELNERAFKLSPATAIHRESTLYDGDLLRMPHTWDMRKVSSIALLDGGIRLALEASMDQDTLYEFWRTEFDWVPGSNAWRERLSPEQAEMVARLDQISDWYDSETSEAWTQEWREELSPWEAALVAKWEKAFRDGLLRWWNEIQTKKQKKEAERSEAAQTPHGL